MMSFLRIVFLGLLCGGGILLPSSSFAVGEFSKTSGQKPLKLAVLDIDRVIRDAQVTIYIQKNVEERREALQLDVEGYEKELREKEATLKKLQNKNDPSFDKAKKDFENDVTDIQKRISGRSKILEKAFHDARSEVIQKVMALVAELADAEGLTLVIPKNVVMYQDDGYDITDRILARLDSDMPSIDIKLIEGV